MVELRTQRDGKSRMAHKSKKQGGGGQEAVGHSLTKTVPRLASHSSNGKKVGSKEANKIEEVFEEHSLLSNDRFAYELSRGVGLEATVQTRNGVQFDGILHSFGRQGEVVVCSALVSVGADSVLMPTDQMLDFVCIAKSDVVSLTIKNVAQNAINARPQQLTTPEDTPSECVPLEESGETGENSVEEAIVPSQEGTNLHQLSNAVVAETVRQVPDEKPKEDRPPTIRPQRSFPASRDGRQFNANARKWHHPHTNYRAPTGNGERSSQETFCSRKELKRELNGNTDGASSHSHDGHEHWPAHSNFNQNSRYFPERRPAVWTNNRQAPPPSSRPEIVNGNNALAVQESSSCHTVTAAPSVDQIKNGHVEKDVDLEVGRSKSASVSSSEDTETVVYRGSEAAEALNPWTSGNVWHRRTGLQGSRVLDGLAKDNVHRSDFVREDSDNQRCVNSFRTGATPLNPHAPEFQPRPPTEPGQLDQYEVESLNDQLHHHPEDFYPVPMYPLDQQQMQPNMLPVSPMFLPLEVAQHGHVQLFPHAAPPFFHTMAPNGQPQGIYVPLMPPLESYYASLLFHQMQAAHLAASANVLHNGNHHQVPIKENNDYEEGLEMPHPLKTTPVLPLMENLMDEKEFPPLPNPVVEKTNQGLVSVNGMA